MAIDDRPVRASQKYNVEEAHDDGHNMCTALLQQPRASSSGARIPTQSYESVCSHYRVKSWKLPDNTDGSGSTGDTKNKKSSSEKDPFVSIRNQVEIKLGACLVAILVYLIVGVAAYSFVLPGERWSVVDSLYFSVVTFTTVGYGDVYPKTNCGRLFTCVFALGGIAGLGATLGVIGNNLLAKDMAHVHSERERHRENVKKMFFTRREVRHHASGGGEEEPVDPPPTTARRRPKLYLRERGQNACRWCVANVRLLLIFLPVVLTILLASLVIALGDGGWGWVEAVYYCIITASTVGYGDITPETPATRWYAVLFIPFAVGVTGVMLGGIAGLIMDGTKAKVMKKIACHKVTVDDLKLVASSGDGCVSRLDFIQFMLVSMQVVDRDFLQDLHDMFSFLDADNNGVLQKHDLELLAERARQRKEGKGDAEKVDC